LLKQEAFGEIGLLPEQFYKMHTDDFLLLRKGFWKKREWEQQLIRRAVALIMSPWLSKPIRPEQIWPLSCDKNEEDAAIKILNYLKNKSGQFEYRKINGVIVEVPIECQPSQ